MEQSFAQRVGSSQVATKSPFLQEGEHTLKIKALKVTGKTPKGRFFVAEFEVIASTVHRVGSAVSWAPNLDSPYSDGDVKSIKRLIGVAIGIDHNDKNFNNEVTAEIVDQAVSDEQPLLGKVVLDTAYMNPNRTYTKHAWRCAE